MMQHHNCALLCATSLAWFAAPVAAQPGVTAAPINSVVIEAAPRGDLLRAGTEVPMRTLTELSSKTGRVGDRFNLEVTDHVMLSGRVVIPAGSQGVGEITMVTKKGMLGKSGKLGTRLLYVRVGDQQIRLAGAVGDRGKGGTAGTVAAIVLVWPAAFFVTGKSALIPPGTTAVGRLESDLSVKFADPRATTSPAPKLAPTADAAVPTLP